MNAAILARQTQIQSNIAALEAKAAAALNAEYVPAMAVHFYADSSGFSVDAENKHEADLVAAWASRNGKACAVEHDADLECYSVHIDNGQHGAKSIAARAVRHFGGR